MLEVFAATRKKDGETSPAGTCRRALSREGAQSLERAYGRVGHLFQGRFKAILAERERDLPEPARDVVLNPVPAGMLEAPGAWPWSSDPWISDRATVGEEGPVQEFLETDWVLRAFAERRAVWLSDVRRDRDNTGLRVATCCHFRRIFDDAVNEWSLTFIGSFRAAWPEPCWPELCWRVPEMTGA